MIQMIQFCDFWILVNAWEKPCSLEEIPAILPLRGVCWVVVCSFPAEKHLMDENKAWI